MNTPEQDREQIAAKAAEDIRAKYDKGQQEHRSDFPTGKLGWFVAQVREEAVDLMAYTHHLAKTLERLRVLQNEMEEASRHMEDREGAFQMGAFAGRLGSIISDDPPQRRYP